MHLAGGEPPHLAPGRPHEKRAIHGDALGPQAREQLTREPRPLPELWLDPSITSIDDFTLDSIKVRGEIEPKNTN